MDSLVLLGDSLFQRAASQDRDHTGQIIGSLEPRLCDAYMRKLDVVNRGFSGYNTRQVLHVLNNVAHVPKRARFVVVLLGANDARLPDTPGGPQQHVPLAEFKSNIAAIVHRLSRRRKAKHIILVTPPPVDERMTVAADCEKDPALKDVIRRKATVTAQYARGVREVARECNDPVTGGACNVQVLNLWGKIIELATPDEAGKAIDSEYLDEYGKTMGGTGMGEDEKCWHGTSLPGSSEAPVNQVLQSYFIDGLHFSRKGYDLFFEELMAVIEKAWPEEMPERLPMAAPAWDEPGKWNDLKAQKAGPDPWEDTPEVMLGMGITLLICVMGWFYGRA